MKDVGAAIRPLGFRGSSGLWRLVTPEGVAVIQKQGSSSSTWADKAFFLNIAVVPTAWWEWNQVGRRKPHPIERSLEWHGIRILEGQRTTWYIKSSTDIEKLRLELRAVAAEAGARLVELLVPGQYLDELRALSGKGIGHWQALAILLAAQGPSAELDAALDGWRAAAADRCNPEEFAQRLMAWAKTRVS